MGLKPPVDFNVERAHKNPYDKNNPFAYVVIDAKGQFYNGVAQTFGTAADATLHTLQDANRIAAARKADIVRPGSSYTLARLFYSDR